MRRARPALAVAAVLLTAACNENSAVGNDRASELDPPRQAAEVMAAGAALQGIASSLVIPQIMTPADQGNVPAMESACLFRMTAVGEPVVVYGPRQAVVKLNGKLVPLTQSGEHTYAADGVTVTVRPLEGEAEAEGAFDAEFVLRLPGAPDELGFHGYAECRGAPM